MEETVTTTVETPQEQTTPEVTETTQPVEEQTTGEVSQESDEVEAETTETESQEYRVQFFGALQKFFIAINSVYMVIWII